MNEEEKMRVIGNKSDPPLNFENQSFFFMLFIFHVNSVYFSSFNSVGNLCEKYHVLLNTMRCKLQ